VTPDQERKLDDLLIHVGQIRASLFGVEGQGGLHERVKSLEAHKDQMTVFKAKLIGVVAGVSGVASFAATKLAHLMHIDKQ
jgi:hypothetical protein